MKKRPGRRSPESANKRYGERQKKYMRARWTKLRRVVLARDNHLCQECKRNGITATGNQIDHIVPARDAMDRFYDANNLQTLCGPCHSRKTQRGE